jgi:formate C-acetyltransferase
MATVLKPANDQAASAWRGFVPGAWQSRVNVRDFIQRNYTPYEGDGAFLSGPTERTTNLWKKLAPLLAKEREKGHPRRLAGSLEHPGARSRLYRQGPRDHRRAANRRAAEARDHAVRGWRVVANSLEAYGYKPDEKVGEIFTKYRRTHNDGVFDAYTPKSARPALRESSPACPDAYGRGRIIGDYRRVALYGVDF